MNKCIERLLMSILMLGSPVLLFAQAAPDWQDRSPHKVQLVTVDEGIHLEVLDWGGSGPAVVLLAGLGNTAHVYDDFAQKLARNYHVFGMTRRGFGASSRPGSGYEVDRLGDDVVAVMDALDLKQVVLVGHSIAGQELSSVAARFPDRLSALVYLDAAYQYAFDGSGTFGRVLAFRKMQMEMPRFLEAITLPRLLPLPPLPQFPQPPRPSQTDMESLSAYISAEERRHGVAMPAAEIGQSMKISQDGSINGFIPSAAPVARQKVIDGGKSFKQIPVRSLAIYAYPSVQEPWINEATPEVQLAMARLGSIKTMQNGRLINEFEKGVPNAQVVRLPGAHHYLFITNEADVLREMNNFLEAGPP